MSTNLNQMRDAWNAQQRQRQQDYVVIENSTHQLLGESVNSMLKCGYKLVGGIAVRADNGYVRFYQAMILESE